MNAREYTAAHGQSLWPAHDYEVLMDLAAWDAQHPDETGEWTETES